MRKVAKNLKDTKEVAGAVLKKLLSKKSKGALVVCLSGELGAGKTAFTKEAAKALGIKTKLSSPTFVIMKNYPLKSKTFKKFFHLDAYRLKHEKELLNLGWKDIVEKKEHLVFIEWPENVKKIIPKDAFCVDISVNEEGHRSFEMK